ncbi:hypothetical protein [Sphingomonas sp. AAP5]|nr:hypothetical protein [Sphingomonas sp. AAP5]
MMLDSHAAFDAALDRLLREQQARACDATNRHPGCKTFDFRISGRAGF